MKKNIFIFSLVAIALLFACSKEEEMKLDSEPVKKLEPGPGEVIFDCRDYIDTNIASCIEGLLPKVGGDTALATSYCECVFQEMLDKYTCEEIMNIKDMSPENQKRIYEPIRRKCYDLYMKQALENKETVSDSVE